MGLLEGGKNAKQVQEWLGDHDAGFTLKTYIHLIDDGLGGADFLDQTVKAGEGGNGLATRKGRKGGEMLERKNRG